MVLRSFWRQNQLPSTHSFQENTILVNQFGWYKILMANFQCVLSHYCTSFHDTIYKGTNTCELPNQTFAKHTYWRIPFKRNRLNQIYSIQFQELKHSRKQTNSTPGSVDPLKFLAMMVVAVVGKDGDRWKTLRTFLWLGSNQSECFRLPLATKNETWTSFGRHIVSCFR